MVQGVVIAAGHGALCGGLTGCLFGRRLERSEKAGFVADADGKNALGHECRQSVFDPIIKCAGEGVRCGVRRAYGPSLGCSDPDTTMLTMRLSIRPVRAAHEEHPKESM